jgi:hypothetical protein
MPETSGVPPIVPEIVPVNVYGRPQRGGPERRMTHFEDRAVLWTFAWARDGRLAVSRGITESDVVLIAAK